VATVVGDGSDLGVRVRYSWEPRILGSAGGPRLARPLVGGDPFLVVNGDTLTDVDVHRLADAHAASDALVTLALVPNREFLRYGGVRLDDEHRVVGFPRRGPAAEGSYHFIGVQMVNGVVFDPVAPGEAASSIGGVYDAAMAARPGAVRGFVSDAAFYDVGTVADYWRTSDAFATSEGAASSGAGHRARIDASARVTRSILWDDVEVGADAMVDECILTDGVVVPPGATYRRAVVVRGNDDAPLTSPLDLDS
jgi:NDP-sugar pyrophosphorylase family protein